MNAIERGTSHEWKEWRTSRLDRAIVKRGNLERSDWKESTLIQQEYKEAVHLANLAIFSMYCDVLNAGTPDEIASTINKLRILRYALPAKI